MTIQMDKKHLLTFMRSESEKILDLLLTFNVPDSIEDNDYDAYLLTSNKNSSKPLPTKQNSASDSIDELQDRLNRIKNKMKTKKGPQTEKAKKRKEAKKLKKNKEFKKVLVSAAKSMKNEKIKQDQDDEKQSKKDIKPIIPKPVFNEEGKIVFSKFDFAQKKKKSHQNPRDILKQLKATDRKINELKESGETEKALEMKNELAWKKAFDKVDGKKVKDDPKLLYKAIKKRKVEKKKSKKQWQERKQKVEKDISAKQKKRQENLDKRVKDKQKTKLKKAAKRGRVIPGF
ncbi:surfeit locus protein 6 homolog [Stomoxys calcitrans]|uniref:Ribosomal RNA-processing protein 14/surfeit locus protein 6 C-terminal domain-containing protein n=1 Tax=Stomoxys calcitrans TaxID=35570 RepID=A0A1I8NYW3_STOCA|nr:surfeit locus protein 6 homolog [Stomoxys calcitrans]